MRFFFSIQSRDEMLLLAIGYTMEKISNNSNILKDLKDIIEMSNSTEQILKDAGSMINCLLQRLQATAKTNSSASSKQVGKQPIKLPLPRPQPPKEDRQRPKPLTSYFIFLKQNRKKVHDYYPELSPPEVVKVMGQIWQKMSASEKEVYVKQHEKSKEEYYRQYGANGDDK